MWSPGLCTLHSHYQGPRFANLVRELRPHKPHSMVRHTHTHDIDTELLAVFQISNFYNFSSIEMLSSGFSEENIIEVTFGVWVYGFRFRGLANSFETASMTLSFVFFPSKENLYLSSDS